MNPPVRKGSSEQKDVKMIRYTFMRPLLTIDLFLLTGTVFSLGGSPCWQSFPLQRGCMRKALCCGTMLLYTPSPASYIHWMSFPSTWRPLWLKELTSDPDQRSQSSVPTLPLTAGMLLRIKHSSFRLWKKKKRSSKT